MHACSSTNAARVTRCCGRNQATAASFAPTARCHVHRRRLEAQRTCLPRGLDTHPPLRVTEPAQVRIPRGGRPQLAAAGPHSMADHVRIAGSSVVGLLARTRLPPQSSATILRRFGFRLPRLRRDRGAWSTGNGHDVQWGGSSHCRDGVEHRSAAAMREGCPRAVGRVDGITRACSWQPPRDKGAGARRSIDRWQAAPCPAREEGGRSRNAVRVLSH